MTHTLTKIATGILSFSIGVIIAWFTVGHFQQLIRNFYQWTTGTAFEFYGKHIIINFDPFYYLTFGIVALTLWTCLQKLEFKMAIIWTTLAIAIFFLTMTVYTLIDGYFRVITCTICDTEIVKLHWNNLNYNLVTEVSLLTAITPLIIMTIMKIKKASA